MYKYTRGEKLINAKKGKVTERTKNNTEKKGERQKCFRAQKANVQKWKRLKSGQRKDRENYPPATRNSQKSTKSENDKMGKSQLKVYK